MSDDERENGVCFRCALPQDAERIHEVNSANFKKPFSLNTIIESVNADIVIVAADESDTVLGYIIGVKNYDVIDIISIAVDEKQKRRGIGMGLLREMIRLNGEFDFWLEVRENNVPAIALYEKNGFRKVGLRKGFYAEYEPPVNAITMNYYK
ncbi:MAG: ribosomal protein S18-alanine N-acetyltransferase [Ruminococcus sp.]|jgi:ribosomal-protein-alanine N-acetyltransferase|nr:ribosomal protein S18-alanine N-acetyltransferase [Ruminococcus sp.]